MVCSESSLGELTVTHVKMWQLRVNSSQHCIVLACTKMEREMFSIAVCLFHFVFNSFSQTSFLDAEDVREKNYPEALSALYHGIE